MDQFPSGEWITFRAARPAEQLRERRPELFESPMARELDLGPGVTTWKMPVRGSLSGEDVYVTKGDYDAYGAVLSDFWAWLRPKV